MLIGPDKSLADISTWADEIKSERRYTAPWHFINIPEGATTYIPARDCGKRGCAISAIDHLKTVLANKSARKEEREEALKFIVHIVGDIHQPLHCGYKSDKGGNTIYVVFINRKSNLHHVWDSDIIQRKNESVNNCAERLVAKADSKQVELWQKGTDVDWALESRSLLGQVYSFDSSGLIGEDYYEKNLPVAETQLLKGGIRLARMLNECLTGKN